MVLENINSPIDLKKLRYGELLQLSREIRELILSVVCRRGGHLAASLGVVELSIALHRVFNTPQDKIIWDVGHQCYAHKILTGRRERFPTLRTADGISGFPRRQESPYDSFNVGHSSTSLSSALGMALARDLCGEKFKVVAVIGDGALTGGMALEALNHAGSRHSDLLVILNDNEMSIEQNVGGLPSYLTRLRSDPMYSRFKEEIESVIGHIPAIGKAMVRSVERLKDGVKYLLVPGILFEELGFKYLGPIDGHNILRMEGMLRQARDLKGPVLLHVLTQKGKGYRFAEEQPCLFHGIGPFERETGQTNSDPQAKPGYSQIFGKTIVELAAQNENIVAITAAMGTGTGLEQFSRRWPERFFDVGIAEQHAVTMAAGLAAGGFRPVVAIYSTFLQRAYDQILHDVCLQNLPVTFIIDRAGLIGEDGETHNGLYDIAFLRNFPNIMLMAPGNGAELVAMLKAAISFNGPAAIRFPRAGAEEPIAPPAGVLTPGKGKLLLEGDDLLILAAGSMVSPALQAGKLLRQEGINCAVINPLFIQPLDRDLLCTWAKRCGKVLTVEEHVTGGGFGSAVLEMLAHENIVGVRVRCLGLPHPLTGQDKRDSLLERYGLTGEGIAREGLRLCAGGIRQTVI
ncbi:MAG: 1-deoxy-D-xylulose-5-phosphate synthase [Bacillota bacterium]